MYKSITEQRVFVHYLLCVCLKTVYLVETKNILLKQFIQLNFKHFDESIEKKLKNKLNSIIGSMNSFKKIVSKSTIELMNNSKNKLKLQIN